MTHELYTKENKKRLVTGVESMLFIASYQRLVLNIGPIEHLSLDGVRIEADLTRVERARADPESMVISDIEYALNNPGDPFNESSLLDGSQSEQGDNDDDIGRYLPY